MKRALALLLLAGCGEDHAGDPVAAAEEAADAGVRIFAVGVGTRDGELIPVREGGRVDYMKDRQGNYVKTRLDEATLAKNVLELLKDKSKSLGDVCSFRMVLGGMESELQCVESRQ